MSAKQDSLLKFVEGQNYSKIARQIERLISDRISKANPFSKGLIVGLSGGLDSAVVLQLSTNALGPQNVLALVMPSNVTPQEDINHAIELAQALKVEHKRIDLDRIIDAYEKVLPDDKRAMGNLTARVRMSILYYYASVRWYLVAGTGDKSEYNLGYFTKYGDGGADIMPIADLYKTEVRALARFLGIPNGIIMKKSSPRLWANHLAEDEIGINYEIVDCILYLMIDKKMKPMQIAKKMQIPREQIDKISDMVGNSAHKRRMAEIMYFNERRKQGSSGN